MQETLTQEILTGHFNQWIKNVGLHRNEQDIRFGQYIWSRYSQQLYEAKSKLPEIEANQDGFYPESPAIAYEQISNLLKA